LIVPLGILLAVQLVPPHLMAEFRATAKAWEGRPVSRWEAVAIVALGLFAVAPLLDYFGHGPK
jgi:hypothetical protein